MDPLFTLLLATLSSLLPITNPLGNAAIFLSITQDHTPAERNRLCRRAAFYMFCILASFLIAGSFILHFFGLSLEGIRIAGGLLIMKFGFDQLQPKTGNTHSKEEHAEAKQKEDISFSPLAMPLLAGPGAIASVMSTSSLVSEPSILNYSVILLGIALTCFVCWILLREAEKMMRFLGVNGANALTKVMGFLLLCIGVQLAIAGVEGLVH
jgi:multiple antibiotic resistance protein